MTMFYILDNKVETEMGDQEKDTVEEERSDGPGKSSMHTLLHAYPVVVILKG